MRSCFGRWLGCATLGVLVVSVLAAPGCSEAQPQRGDPDYGDYIRFSSDRFYRRYREITYWAAARFAISDYNYGTDDVERLGLVVKDPAWNNLFTKPAPELEQHFLQEFRRFFGDLPFHDNEVGSRERYAKFKRENDERAEDFSDQWEASELARRRALYPGRSGFIACDVKVKRRAFPVLYVVECYLSTDENLSLLRPLAEGSTDIGFSSTEHISGEIKRAITERLQEIGARLAKIRKYGKRP